MTERIPTGAPLPSICGGVLLWCEGDVFTFTLKLRLFSLGEELSDLTEYRFGANFYDASGDLVHSFTADGDGSCTFPLAFTEEVSAKFPKGIYHFDVRVTAPDGTVSTVANDAPAHVR